MKKRLKVAVSFLVTICLMFAGGGGVSAQNMMWDAADMYVMEQVETISENRELAGLTWNDETEIQTRIPLYAPNGEISGYIYHFITNGTQTGFMQTSGEGHAVDVWGYCEDSGANYLCITDNQDGNSTNTPSAYLINSSAYSFAQGVYAGLAL